MITLELKQKIREALALRRENFTGTDSQYAVMLGISSAIYNRIKKGETDKVLADAKWISLARMLEVQIGTQVEWKTVETPVYKFITAQLEMCQNEGISTLLCDVADIGKTYTARSYVKQHRNAIYVDCSQVKSKQKLVRYIAKEFGVGHTGRYTDVYEDLVFYLRSIANPLIILDEAGDLEYSAFLELKAMWNATERCCGWYMMGADGLRVKIERAIDVKKVGYTELFSRFGKRFQKIVPEGEEKIQFLQSQAAMLIKANAPQADVRKMVVATDGSLRRVFIEVKKIINNI